MKLPTVPTEGFLQALPPEEREKLGKAGLTKAEARALYEHRQERELQRDVWNYLTLKGVYFESDRMDKRTSGKKGRADFRCCVDGKFLALECKVETGTLSKAQAAEAARLRKSGGKFAVVFTLQDAIETIREVESI